jgi:hypothetical protein
MHAGAAEHCLAKTISLMNSVGCAFLEILLAVLQSTQSF